MDAFEMTALPPVPDTYRWTTESWGAALRCRPLEAIAAHVFAARQLDLSAPAGYGPIATALGALRVVTVNQVHGAEVLVVRDGAGPAWPGAADAIIACRAGLAVAIRAADCAPILMADPRTGSVAAVHAGWRGTAARVAVHTLRALDRQFGSCPADLVVAIGPAIGACCYEVGTDVVDAFAAAGHERYLIDRWFLAEPPARGAFAAGRAAERPRLRLDLARANRDQLVLAGVPETQIHTAGLCTAMHLEVLTSYRAEGTAAGRLVAAIRSIRD